MLNRLLSYFLIFDIKYAIHHESRSLSFLCPQLSCHAGESLTSLLTDCMKHPKYYSFLAVLALMAISMLVQVSHKVKITLMLTITIVWGIINIFVWSNLYKLYDLKRYEKSR